MSTTTIDIDALCSRVESAIDAHPRLMRSLTRGPHLRWGRDGATMVALVKLRGSRKIKLDSITGRGDTPEDAADKLIASLDNWATALTT